MKPYSYDLRSHVVSACIKGRATREAIARMFGVSARFIRHLFQRLRQSETFAALPPRGGPHPKLTPAHERRLAAAVKKRPDATLEQLRKACGAPVSKQTICRHLHQLGLERKRKRLHASERDTPETQAKRAAWRAQQGALEPERLVFADELGAQTTLTPAYGRAPKGERVEEAVPADHWRTTTLVQALRLTGPCAAMTLAGPLDGESFRVWVERVLLPTLKPGDIVIWDNLPVHQRAQAEELLARVGALLLPLPPYSPDYNPIEAMGSKIKEFLRRVKARGERALNRAIARALATITPQDIQGWFAHCGYRNTVT